MTYWTLKSGGFTFYLETKKDAYEAFKRHEIVDGTPIMHKHTICTDSDGLILHWIWDVTRVGKRRLKDGSVKYYIHSDNSRLAEE